MKKTKVVCSIGPTSNSMDVLRGMIESGMNVARFDLGKFSYSFCSEVLEKIRKLELDLDKTIGIMFENRGPEIRIGTLANGKVFLKGGSEIEIYGESMVGSEEKISIQYPNLIKDVRVGMELLLHNGRVKIKVIRKMQDHLVGVVEIEGFVFSHETVHIPKLDYTLDYLSKKDQEDIQFAIKEDVDFLALSFVRNSNDVLDVTDLLIENGNDHIQLITKIENEFCLEDIDHIIELSDGIMIARGDLGVELPMEFLPGIQKQLICKVHQANKIGIISTEMLASMETEIRPTRAEVSDVYNAVIDLADAVSLGKETSIGNHPIQAVQVMTRILEQAEKEMDYEQILKEINGQEKRNVTSSIAHSVVDVANQLQAKVIITATNSGYTAKKISRYRPSCPIIATSPEKETVRSLVLHYGILPVLSHQYHSTDDIIHECKELANQMIKFKKNDYFIITGGFPASLQNTNFMRVEEVL